MPNTAEVQRKRRICGGGASPGGWALLTEAKSHFLHGEWGDWLGRVGLRRARRPSGCALPRLGITAEDVIARGGISATLKGKSATVADLPGDGDVPAVSEAA